MKKLLVLLLVFSMSFSLVACNDEFGFNKEDSEETLTESEKDYADDISDNEETREHSLPLTTQRILSVFFCLNSIHLNLIPSLLPIKLFSYHAPA